MTQGASSEAQGWETDAERARLRVSRLCHPERRTMHDGERAGGAGLLDVMNAWKVLRRAAPAQDDTADDTVPPVSSRAQRGIPSSSSIGGFRAVCAARNDTTPACNPTCLA
jgi:hypothetical protein